MKLKRLFAVMVCVLMVAALLPLGVAAQEEEEEPVGFWERSEGARWTEVRREQVEDPIIRIYGNNRYETSMKLAEICREGFGGKLQNVIIACGTDFPDALGAAGPAYELAAPIILVDKNRVKQVAAYVGENLETGGEVFIMGGTGAVPASMETELVAAGVVQDDIYRLEGATRYETNMAVLDGYGKYLDYVMVCSGKDYADALSASAFGAPILLVGDKLTDAQKAFLAEKETCYFDIIGGEAAVSASVEADLRAIAAKYSDGGVERFAGRNRYETSKAVAEAGWEKANYVVLSYGLDFPDGLSGAILCFITDSPMLLATTSNISVAAECAHNLNAKNVIVLGGPTLISDDAALKLVQ